MSTFNLSDCPKLGPYWLAKTHDGKLAILKPHAFQSGAGILVGDADLSSAVWDYSGHDMMNRLSMDLIGPWDGKAIIGWTAEEMAKSYVEKTGWSSGWTQCAIDAMQSLIDNKPQEPVKKWKCFHVNHDSGKCLWFYVGKAPTECESAFCPDCGKARPK